MSKKTNPSGFDGLRGLPRLWKRGSTPINKSGLNDLERHLPQIDSPILLGAAAVGALGAGLALSRLRSGGRGGRSERFEQWVCQALKRADGTIPEGDEVVRRIQVEVLEGFGKMPLVDIEILVDDQALVWTHLMGEDLTGVVIVSGHGWSRQLSNSWTRPPCQQSQCARLQSMCWKDLGSFQR